MGRASSRIHAIADDAARDQAPKVPWQERLAAMVASTAGWQDFLACQAEHPGLSPYNACRLMEYRAATGITDTRELLRWDEVKKAGGHVRKGAKGVTQVKYVTNPDGTSEYRNTTYFPARMCDGLSRDRYHGYAHQVSREDSRDVGLFLKATEDVDLDGLNDDADWAFSARYGLLDPGDAVPEAPSGLSPERLVDRCKEVAAQMREVCAKVDRSLKLLTHPEWAEDAETPEQVEGSSEMVGAAQAQPKDASEWDDPMSYENLYGMSLAQIQAAEGVAATPGAVMAKAQESKRTDPAVRRAHAVRQ